MTAPCFLPWLRTFSLGTQGSAPSEEEQGDESPAAGPEGGDAPGSTWKDQRGILRP